MPIPNLTPDRRREIAHALDIDEQYLYQIIKGIKIPAAALARQLHDIDPDFRLQELRPDDFGVIWPELIGTEGAPAIEAKAA